MTGVEATYLAVHDHLASRPVTGAGGAAGWATDEAAELARWAGAFVDHSPVLGLGRALAADDVARELWETGKLLVGGPNRWSGGGADPEPVAPAAPRPVGGPPLDELS
ncbi:MAG: hypothetical protein WEB03_09360 [Nitriliruptor sp.]|uniref:hypothetical protein n=1 Tax=Nitriliruptor sp. TaxID=2448056 RepID=UPI0034A048E8